MRLLESREPFRQVSLLLALLESKLQLLCWSVTISARFVEAQRARVAIAKLGLPKKDLSFDTVLIFRPATPHPALPQHPLSINGPGSPWQMKAPQ